MRLARRPGAVSLGAAVLLPLLAGCHRGSQQPTARLPPPPPVSGTSDDPDGRVVGVPSRPRPPAARTTPAPTAPAGSETLRGRPFEVETGIASWYGPPYAGRRGADGTVYDQNAMTAAHLTLALGTVVRVTNLANGQSVVVRITDRGPFVQGRIIDLSLAAAKATGVYRAGTAQVRVEAFSSPPLAPGSYPGGRWCVQVGAFPTEADAHQEKLELMGRYTGAKVMDFQGPTGWWVRIHPKIADHQHAAEVADSIHLPDAAQPYLTRTD